MSSGPGDPGAGDPGRPPAGRSARARRVAGATLVALALGTTWLLLQRPSNERDWPPNVAVMPRAEFLDGDLVRLHDIRNTSYRTVDDYTPRYYDRTFDLAALESVWFVVEPFSRWGGAAHTFLSFGFRGGDYVTVSVEARKERGETYHFLKGLFRRYELIYVVADERDAIGMRADVRGDQVFLYPVRAPRERIRELFVDMLERANRLRREPEFYNTLFQNCTNTLVQHVNTLVPERIPFSHRVLLPGYSDRLAYDLGLIDTELPFEEARERFRITGPARRHAGAPDFSERIRR